MKSTRTQNFIAAAIVCALGATATHVEDLTWM
jgi:hypothetical protein